MINQLHYKNYIGCVFFSEEDGVFYGKISGISDSISFEGESVKELTEDFRNAVDEYLEFCASMGKQPEESVYSINISRDLHNIVSSYVNEKGLPLNVFIENAIKSSIGV